MLKKRLGFTLVFVMMLLLFASFVRTSKSMRAGGIEEFNNFKHFDRKENLIHIFSQYMPEFQNLPENHATVKEEQLITWGFEWYHYTEEDLNNVLESVRSSTVFKIDGVAVNGWFYTDAYFFETYDHDGDGPGDGDGDGIGDGGPDYYCSAFRYSTILDVGEHTWYFEVFDPETSNWLVDSGTVLVLPGD